MDFQEFVDSYSMAAAVLSVEKFREEHWDEIRIVKANTRVKWNTNGLMPVHLPCSQFYVNVSGSARLSSELCGITRGKGTGKICSNFKRLRKRRQGADVCAAGYLEPTESRLSVALLYRYSILERATRKPLTLVC